MAEYISGLILEEHLSPEKIVDLLAEDDRGFPDVPQSSNTIYNAIDKGLIPNVTRESLLGSRAMVITQIAFEIPLEIQAGIDAGALLRFGGIIRDRAGHIVKHLEEVSILEADNSAGESTIVLIIGTAIAAIAAGVIYVVVKNKKNKEERIPKCVADFNESFAEYVDSIKMGAVSEEKIDKVMTVLEEIKRNQEKETITITFSAENISLLLGMVRDYTMKFAEANSFEI